MQPRTFSHRRNAARAAALGLAASLAWAGASPASTQTDFDMTIGTTYSNGSGIALGSNFGIYAVPTSFPVDVTIGPGAGEQTLDIMGITIPDIQNILDPTKFRFTLLGDPLLTFEDATGEINFDLLDAPVTLLVEQVQVGNVIESDQYAIEFTSGTITIPTCGVAAAHDVTGWPVDPGTKAVTLVAGICLANFGNTTGFNMPLEIKLDGILPVPEPVAHGLALAALASMGILRARRCRRT